MAHQIYKAKGVALMMVVAIVTLASMLSYQLVEMTFFNGSKIVSNFSKTKGEFLARSLLEFARVIISLPGQGPNQEMWRQFLSGTQLPPGIIEIADEDIVLALEISPPRGLPLNWLRNSSIGGSANTNLNQDFIQKRDIFLRLFELTGVNQILQAGQETGQNFRQQKGPAPSLKNLVATLIDYVDVDSNTYEQDGFIGGENDTNQMMPNSLPESISELVQVPQYNGAIVQLIGEHINTSSTSTIVNPNFTTPHTLAAIDPELSLEQATQIINAANNGDTLDSSNIGSYWPDYNKYARFVQLNAMQEFNVICKVETPDSITYLKAVVSKPNSQLLPQIINLEVY